MIYFYQIFILRFSPTDVFWYLTFCVQYTVFSIKLVGTASAVFGAI